MGNYPLREILHFVKDNFKLILNSRELDIFQCLETLHIQSNPPLGIITKNHALVHEKNGVIKLGEKIRLILVMIFEYV